MNTKLITCFSVATILFIFIVNEFIVSCADDDDNTATPTPVINRTILGELFSASEG